MKKQTAAALVLVTVPALAGATTLQDTATAGTTTHTKHLVLHETGSHELLNWLVLLGAVSPARGRVRFFGEMGRIDLAALEWSVA